MWTAAASDPVALAFDARNRPNGHGVHSDATSALDHFPSGQLLQDRGESALETALYRPFPQAVQLDEELCRPASAPSSIKYFP